MTAAKQHRSPVILSLADHCGEIWPQITRLELQLSDGLQSLPSCKYLFVLVLQITDNISSSARVPEYLNRDRSERPYLRESLAGAPFLPVRCLSQT